VSVPGCVAAVVCLRVEGLARTCECARPSVVVLECVARACALLLQSDYLFHGTNIWPSN